MKFHFDNTFLLYCFLPLLLAASLACDRLPDQQESLEIPDGQNVAVPCQGIQILEPVQDKTLEIDVQEEQQIRYRLLPKGCTDTVEFKVADSRIAFVYPSGRVRGLSSGETDISLECREHKEKIHVRVSEKKITGISFAQTERKMSLGHSYAIAYEVRPNQEFSHLLQWTFPAPEDMEVKLDGPVMHIRPIRTGHFRISAAYKEYAANLDMEVVDLVGSPGQITYYTDEYPTGNVCTPGEWLFYDRLHHRHGYDVPVLEFSLCDGSDVDMSRLRVGSSLPGTLTLETGQQEGVPANIALIRLYGSPESDRPEVSVYYDGKLIVYFTVIVNIPDITG